MKKAISLMGWVSVVLTIISLVFTLCTAYSLMYYVTYFNSYQVLQWCIFFTMLIWAVRLFELNSGKQRFIYSAICIFFAVGTIFFIFMRVTGQN